MLKAGAGRDLRIMFPMIANVAEFDLAKAITLREMELIRRHDHGTPTKLELGAMVEVPALLWELDQIAERADFLSVGSNDLVQYLYAADRDNTRVSKRYDNLSTPVLRALKSIVDAGERAGTPVTLCGEMGGRPLGGARAAGDRLSFAVDVAGLDRSGQGDDPRARSRTGAAVPGVADGQRRGSALLARASAPIRRRERGSLVATLIFAPPTRPTHGY